MQDAPDKGTLLAGVAMFLAAQVEPALKSPGAHKGLAFRSRIAAHLIATVGRELALEDTHDAAELKRLRDLSGQGGEPLVGDARRAEIGRLRGALVERLRGGETIDDGPIDDAATRAALMQTLREQLAVVQPRFDTTVELKEVDG